MINVHACNTYHPYMYNAKLFTYITHRQPLVLTMINMHTCNTYHPYISFIHIIHTYITHG